MLTRYFLLGILLILSAPAFAQNEQVFTVPTVPNPKDAGNGYVSDPGNYLTAQDVAMLNSICTAIEDSVSAEIAIVLLPSIGGDNPKMFATELFNTWGIGKADKDNGLLILSVMDQRRTEFETGYGMEAVLPDVYCYRIGMQELVPHFRQGEYGRGLLATLNRIREILYDPGARADLYSEQIGRRGGGSREPARWLGFHPALFIYIVLTLTLHLIILVAVLAILRDKQDLHDKYLAIRKFQLWWLILLFPLPYIFVFFLLKNYLTRLRNKPRFSKATGKPMRKLTEEEEDEFLEHGQITEEEIGSVDYDVWVTDELDDVVILRYARRFSKYKFCPSCNFVSYYHASTRTISPATYTHSGQGVKIYQCKNCGYTRRKTYTIPRKVRSTSGGGRSGGGFGGGGSWGGGSSGGGGGGVSW